MTSLISCILLISTFVYGNDSVYQNNFNLRSRKANEPFVRLNATMKPVDTTTATVGYYENAFVQFDRRKWYDFSGGDGNIGNGGGSWVCRNWNGAVRWFYLLDLFEAESFYSLNVKFSLKDSYSQAVEMAQKLSQFSPYRAQQILLSLRDVSYKWPRQDSGKLPIIFDTFFRQIPDGSNCPFGLLKYEQIVNYTDNGQILVNQELFNYLSNTEKAALFLHEAIYAVQRHELRVTNSLSTRKLVGYLFSTSSDETLETVFIDVFSKDSELNKPCPRLACIYLNKF